jgi:hypothetical protein
MVILKILYILLFLLFLADLFTWLLAGASSHNVPSGTNRAFGISCGVILALAIFVVYLNRRLKNKRGE